MMMKYSFPEYWVYQFASFIYGVEGKIAFTNIFSVLIFMFLIICSFFAISNSYNKKDFKYPLSLNLLKLKVDEEGDFRVTF
jgi:uncharacterized Tic20 family protein